MKTRGQLTRPILVSILLFWAHLLYSAGPTNVSGIFGASTTWTLANSPYVVTGNILISTDVTLTIEPGVTVSFQAGKFLQVNGTLIADGTAYSTIIFTSAQNTPASGDWGPIKFTRSSVGATVSGSDYVTGSLLRYVRIEYGKGVGLVDAYPYFSNDTFYKNAGNNEGVVTGCVDFPSALHWTGRETSSGTLVVKNNLFDRNDASAFATNQPGGGSKVYSVISNQFLNNTGTAITICHTGSGTEISANLISGNRSGISLGSGSSASITNNVITGCTDVAYTNGIAIDIYSGDPLIQNNLISDNKHIATPGHAAMINIFSIGSPTVLNNTFWSNQAQELIYFKVGGGGTYQGNNFQNNQVQRVFYREPQSPAGADATGNYWGTTDTSVIDDLIYDFYDDFNPGTISYVPFLNAPNPAAPTPKRRRGQLTSQ